MVIITGMVLQTYFSIQHALSASRFARAAREQQLELTQTKSSELRQKVIANTTAAVFSATAFLEATANEIFAEAERPDHGMLKDISQEVNLAIAQLGQVDAVDRASIQDKLDIILLVAGRSRIDRAKRPGQDVATLIQIRNGLMHYRGTWLDWGTSGMARARNLFDSNLWKRMTEKFDVDDPSMGGGSSGWINAACARWAVESAIAYSDEFFSNLGVTSFVDHVRQELRVEDPPVTSSVPR